MESTKEEFKYLVRITNTDLDGNKPIHHSLRKIKGVGVIFANMLCNITNIEKNKKTGYLNDEEIKKLDEVINDPIKFGAPLWILNRRKDPDDGKDKHLVTANLSFIQENDIKILKKIKAYRGVRHMFNLPSRGQKTKSNFRKNKGKVTAVKRKTGARSGRV